MRYKKDMYDGWKPDEFHETLLDARKCRKISDKYNNIAEYSQILFMIGVSIIIYKSKLMWGCAPRKYSILRASLSE